MISTADQSYACGNDCDLLNANENMSFFGEHFAEVYDGIMARVPYASWVDYLEDTASAFNCKVTTLLDAACGTGAFAMLALDRGMDVIGVDASARMLERFKLKLRHHPNAESCRVLESPMADFQILDQVDAAVCFFDSLNYTVREDQFAAALRRISNALKAGGVFVFDVNNEIAYKQNLFQQSGRVETERASTLEFEWSGQYCAQHLLYQLELHFRSLENSALQFRERHTQRFYPRETIQHYLACAGFDDVRCFRAFSFEQGSACDERWSFVAIKN